MSSVFVASAKSTDTAVATSKHHHYHHQKQLTSVLSISLKPLSSHDIEVLDSLLEDANKLKPSLSSILSGMTEPKGTCLNIHTSHQYINHANDLDAINQLSSVDVNVSSYQDTVSKAKISEHTNKPILQEIASQIINIKQAVTHAQKAHASGTPADV